MKIFKITEQLNGDYFTFYDNAQGTILREFEGFEYASVKVAIDDVAGPYGSVYITSKFGARRFAIKGDLISDTIYALRQRLQKALRQTGTIKLIQFTTYDDLELQCEAEVVSVVSPYTHKIHEYLIEFKAPDWRFYSQELITQEMGITSVLGGADIQLPETPVTIDDTPPAGTEINNIVINNGDEITDPIFRITGPGTNFTIENITSDKTLTLTSVIVGGDTVEIDVKNRTVIKNGTDNLYPDVDGDFWSLLPGENELRFFVESDDEIAVTKLEVIFRHAYSGI